MRVGIYCCMSGEDSKSIQNRKAMLISYAKEIGWDIYDIYCDVGTREEFDRNTEADVCSNKGTVIFDIICGDCKGKISLHTCGYLHCENCKKCINGDFIKHFFDKKYEGKIRRMEITNEYSAKIFLNN